MAEFLGTALMILFGVGVHCDEVLNKTKYRGSGHLFAITTWGFGITVVLFVFGGAGACHLSSGDEGGAAEYVGEV